MRKFLFASSFMFLFMLATAALSARQTQDTLATLGRIAAGAAAWDRRK